MMLIRNLIKDAGVLRFYSVIEANRKCNLIRDILLFGVFNIETDLHPSLFLVLG